jgi:di/tripeptidase
MEIPKLNLKMGLEEAKKIIEKIFKEQMNKALNDYNSTVQKGPKLSLNFEKIGERPSGVQDESLSLIQRAAAANEFFNRTAKIGAGSTNSNIPISLGIPSITIGRGGNSGNSHSLDEWWINEKGDEAIKFGLMLLILEAGLSK